MDVRDLKLKDKDKDYDMSCCMWTTYNYLSMDIDLKKFIKSVYNLTETPFSLRYCFT